MKEFFSNVLACAIGFAVFAAVWEIPHVIHDTYHCNHHDCDWFWCDYYNGK